ncbi:hypothetical protein EUX98_g8307 [Antrodiella citrinella]|uniref:ATP-dependent DNA helicase n=1 Tax=Antrodiella citrinella TaxID=2447956 RepID=A0A4S4M8G5_9APHY|nr:hypothetical protein EUX98_g8307 [Antrodiella citrinella]
MLMLFKPWRTGKDLKEDGYGWDATFNAHHFSLRQSEIIKFFHIRYECNDARDDFSAQKKAGLLQAKLAMYADEEYHQGAYDLLDDNIDLAELENEVRIAEQENELDKGTDAYYRNKINAMKLRTYLTGIDALTESGEKLDTHVSEPTNGESQPSQVWKALLKQAKDTVLDDRADQAKKKKVNEVSASGLASEVNEVKVVNKSYLTKLFVPNDPVNKAMISRFVKDFTLNEEQERAFRIIANHSVQDSGEQLLMYLGGMAGTGKSQVIKALIALYTERDEEYRFQCLAPTGTAAALIGGSTYHSILGINQFTVGKSDSSSAKAQIHNRLSHIDYIFIDEVSMIDCKSLNKISAKMCNAMGVYDKPFGGKSVILAGDFAQLAPVSKGPALARGNNGKMHMAHVYDSGHPEAEHETAFTDHDGC